MKLIDKDALVAKIERIEYETNYEPFTDEVFGKRKVCKDIKDFLNTLEVKDVNSKSKVAYKQGYQQAEKDLLENKHEKSWRLDEKLWKGIKDTEEASYQYTYDASNDWAYDIPTWEDVQDAFKAGANWQKEQMMKNAVEAVISQVPGFNEIVFYNPASVYKYSLPQEMNKLGLNKGDKVKLIIIKEG